MQSSQQLLINYHQQRPKLTITWNTTTSDFIDMRVSAVKTKYSIHLQLDTGIAINDLHSHMAELPLKH